jgi:hypothetical protein
VLEQAGGTEERRGLAEAQEVLVEGLDDGLDVLLGEVVDFLEPADVALVELEEALAHRKVVHPEADRLGQTLVAHAWPRDRHVCSFRRPVPDASRALIAGESPICGMRTHGGPV